MKQENISTIIDYFVVFLNSRLHSVDLISVLDGTKESS